MRPEEMTASRLAAGCGDDGDRAVARERLTAVALAKNATVGDLLRRSGWTGQETPSDAVIAAAVEASKDVRIDEGRERAQSATSSKIVSRATLLDELHREAIERAEARASGKPLGPEVAAISPVLHQAMSERLPIGMVTIDGGPGAGKTAFALQIAMTARVPALIVECEVRPVRLLERMTAYTTDTYLGKIKDGTLVPDAIRALAARTLDALPLVELLDATTGVVTLDEIVREACGLRERHGAKHVLVVLDSLHAWAGRTLTGDKEYDRLGKAISTVDAAAKAHNIVVVAILERSLATMQTPSATSGKGHVGIGYNAEISLNLDAKSATDRDTGMSRVDLTVSKNRHGQQNFVIPLTFEGRLQRFAEVQEGDTVEEVVAQIARRPPSRTETNYDDGDLLDPMSAEPFPQRPDDDGLPTLEEFANA